MDGTIPTGRLPEVLAGIDRIVRGYGLKVGTCSTPATATCTPSSCSTPTIPSNSTRAERAGADILKLCVEVGGCLTGEHGVGIEKRDLMTHQFRRREPRSADAGKLAFDPKWLLNPAKVYPLDRRPPEMLAAAE